VTGANFVAASTVHWNGSTLPTTYVSATSIQASVPASDIAKAGTATITLTRPAPGGGTSVSITFVIASTAAH